MTTAIGGVKISRHAWIIAACGMAIIGGAAWIIQLTQGMGVLGLGISTAFGLYIAFFMTLEGGGCGLLALAALGDLGIMPAVQRTRKQLLIGALAAFLSGGLMILLDLGHPERLLSFFSSPRLSSPFVWDFFGILLALAVTLFYVLRREKPDWLAPLGLAVAVGLLLVEGLILSVLNARPLWNSSLLPFSFMLDGLLLALSLFLLTSAEAGHLKAVTRGIVVLIGLDLLLLFSETITSLYGGDPNTVLAMQALLTGSGAIFFWPYIVLAKILPILLIVRNDGGRSLRVIAAILAMAGVLAGKITRLSGGQTFPYLRSPLHYSPSLVEVGVVVGVLGIALLLFALGRRTLIVGVPTDGEPQSTNPEGSVTNELARDKFESEEEE